MLNVLECRFKEFHFIEIDWTLCFPNEGNSGEYRNYCVILKKGKSQTGHQVKLRDILDDPEFESQYPHTVGYYKSSGKTTGVKPAYLELRKIGTIEEFWFFLSTLNI